LDAKAKRVAGPWTFDPQNEAPSRVEVEAMNTPPDDDE
jgi:hypothetical protein